MKTVKWYQEKSFLFSVIAVTVIFALMAIGIWIVDGKFYWDILWCFTFPLILMPILAYIMRNNP